MAEKVTCPFCESGKQVVLATDEDIREAVSQLFDLNGTSDSGWKTRELLEHAADTESILRQLISGTILNGSDEATNEQT